MTLSPPTFTATLGLPVRPKPALRPGQLPPAHLLRDAYQAHVAAQLAETASNRLVDGVQAFQHTGLHKRAAALHYSADQLLERLFGSFSAEQADILNHLTRTVEAATASLITLAIAPDTADATLERVSELVSELAALAGLETLPA